jgi:hypothetical protein
MKSILRSVAVIASLATLMTSCAYEKEELLPQVCEIEDVVTYSADISGIIQNNCFACHNNGFKEGNVSLEGFENARQVANSGKLINVISHTAGFAQMPKGAAKLDDCTIQTVKKWIDNGTPEN